jgi:hypothetical protein
MSGCTWEGCGEPGTAPLHDRNGKRWALLCVAHEKELDAAILGLDAKAVIRCWVKASGGAKRLADEMAPGIQAGCAAIAKLAKSVRRL